MADLDLLTEDEARSAVLRYKEATGLDDLLFAMNSAVAGDIDELCGPVVAREVTARLSGCETVDGGLLLRITPVLEVTAVSTFTGATETVLVDGDWDLIADTHNAKLYRSTGGYDVAWPTGRRNVHVTFTAGRFEDTAAVTEKWKDAARALLIRRWIQQSPSYARQIEADTGEPFIPSVMSAKDAIATSGLGRNELLPPGCA